MLKAINPTQTAAWKALQQHFSEMKDQQMPALFERDPQRFERFSKRLGEELLVDYSKNIITSETLDLLLQLAKECQLSDGIQQMFSGAPINQTECR